MTVSIGDQCWQGTAAPAAAEEREEARWIERARAGDEAAFRWLLDCYRERAVRLAAHVLRQPDEAEDVAQEAFIRAFRGLSSFRGDGRFYTWLYHIVVRVCLDRKRRAWWSREATSAPRESAGSEATEGVDTRLLVEALLDRLNPPMRAALVLRELEGLEYEEIAQVLGVPVGTVRSRLNTARAQFRSLWSAAMRELDDV